MPILLLQSEGGICDCDTLNTLPSESVCTIHTYSGDHSTSEEESTAEIPVAEVVRCVSYRTHSSAEGVNGVLRRENTH